MLRLVLLVLAGSLLLAAPATADDDERRFRRTTPRAALETRDGTVIVGIPSGRAWGVESELRALPPDGSLAVRLAVGDDAVREAFVRVAYYATTTGHPRQIAIADTEDVIAGEQRLLVLRLDPPTGAVAYRVRVLARLRPGAPESRSDAIRARLAPPAGASARFGSLWSRLLPDVP